MKTIITIGRQYGSGGREIGEKLAKQLNIPFYDSKLLEIAAKESGISQEFFENNDEKPVNSLLYILSNTYSDDNLPFNHKLFLAQFDAIKKIAEQGGCVIVGRCADYALRENPDCINLFIHADLQIRKQRAIEKYGIEEKRANEVVIRKDKQRASYYNFYTPNKWGHADNYDLVIDSGKIGIDNAVEIIKKYIELKNSIEN